MSKFPIAFRPRLFDELKTYNRSKFFRDLAAGLTVGVVALPLAMAFAIASGAQPGAGIFTSIIAGFLISALGGSRVQIGGPAGAFIVIIYGIIERYGLANLFISTILAGVLLFSMGVFRLGSLIRFIPVAIVIGFTNGIAVLIALSQAKDLFGLKIEKMPGDFFLQIQMLAQHAGSVDFTTLALGLVSLALLFSWPTLFKVSTSIKYADHPDAPEPVSQMIKHKNRLYDFLRAVPGPVVVLVLSTIAVSLLHLPVETIGSKFGGIPQELPAFTLPVFSWALVKQLFAPTLTIAMLGAIESLLSARVADNLIDERHDPNQELMAQGIANFFTPFFGGLPATGTVARTVTNIRSGASSPISGMIHALTLLFIVLVAAPLAQNIPLAALAAILLYVAFNMGEWREFIKLKKFSLNYRIVMVGTFLLTVIFDLTVAVEVGLVLACVFFIYRISNLTTIEKIPVDALTHPLPDGVIAYTIFGSLFFGAVDKIEQISDPKSTPPKVMILELHQMINLDTTGLDALEMLLHFLQKHDSQLIICGLNKQPQSIMRRSGFLENLGEKNRVANLTLAIERAREIARHSPV